MRRLTLAFLVLCAALLYFAPGSRALMSGVAYTDFANIFTSNQRINAGLGVNAAPGSTGTITASGALFELGRSTANGVWTSYTPTWTASVTNPTIGNGSIAGSYALTGGTMFISIRISGGSTTNYGAGTWSIGFPGTVTVVNPGVQNIGNCLVFDSGTAFYTGAAFFLSTTTFTGLVDGATNTFTQLVPMTWGNGDYLQCFAAVPVS